LINQTLLNPLQSLGPSTNSSNLTKYPFTNLHQQIPSFLQENTLSTPLTKEYFNGIIGLKFRYDSKIWNIDSNSTNIKNNCSNSCQIILNNKDNKIAKIEILAQNTSLFTDRCNCSSLIDYMKVRYESKYLGTNMTLIQDNQTKLNDGSIAWQMQYDTPGNIKNYLLWFLKNNIFYELKYYTNSNNFINYLPSTKFIIESLEFYIPNPKLIKINDHKDGGSYELPSFMKENSKELNPLYQKISKWTDKIKQDVCDLGMLIDIGQRYC
jgi:hypothetical protein